MADCFSFKTQPRRDKRPSKMLDMTSINKLNDDLNPLDELDKQTTDAATLGIDLEHLAKL